MIEARQQFSATLAVDLPEGIVILSPAYHEGGRYRIVATSTVSALDAQNTLMEAALAIREQALKS